MSGRSMFRHWTLGFSLLFPIFPSFGQAPPPQEPPQKSGASPSVRATTRLVQLSVIAEDKNGKPVTNLTKEDFILLDEERREEISFFAKETKRALAGPIVTMPRSVKLFSNRLEERSGVPSAVTIILLDYLNTPAKDTIVARQQLLKFLGQMQPTDRIALYALTNELVVLHDFTSDATELLQTIQEYQGRNMAGRQPGPEVSLRRNVIGRLLLEDEVVEDLHFRYRHSMTRLALLAIARHVARLPGRKNLIWITGGLPVDEQVRDFLSDTSVAIYPVHARGLLTYGISAADASDSANVRRAGVPSPGQSRFYLDLLVDVAQKTGGRAFYNVNDLSGSIRRAMDDSEVTYALGFYPTHDNWNGMYRKLSIQVKRPGVTVRHRSGYSAEERGRPHLREEKQILDMAFSNALDLGMVGMRVLVKPPAGSAEGPSQVMIQLDPRDLSFKVEGDRWVGSFDLFFVQRNQEGKQLAVKSERIELSLTEKLYDDLMRNGALVKRDLELVEGATELRVVAWDYSTGSVGSIIIPLRSVWAMD